MELNALTADIFRDRLLATGDVVGWERSYIEFPALEETPEPSKWDFHALNNTTSKHPVTIQRVRQTVSLIKKQYVPGMTVLDFGVGYGDVARQLRKSSLEFTYHGIDISPQFVSNLQAEFIDDPRFTFTREPLNGIRSSYDLILALEVLEHISPTSIFSVLHTIYRLLTPHGKFIASVPLYEDLALTTKYCPETKRLENSNGHLRSYTPDLLCAELKKSGFIDQTLSFVKSGYSLKSRLYHFFVPGQAFNVITCASL